MGSSAPPHLAKKMLSLSVESSQGFHTANVWVPSLQPRGWRACKEAGK